MPKEVPQKELEAIAAIVAANPDGVQVKTIRDGLEFDLPPRMRQRRLSLLKWGSHPTSISLPVPI